MSKLTNPSWMCAERLIIAGGATSASDSTSTSSSDPTFGNCRGWIRLLFPPTKMSGVTLNECWPFLAPSPLAFDLPHCQEPWRWVHTRRSSGNCQGTKNKRKQRKQHMEETPLTFHNVQNDGNLEQTTWSVRPSGDVLLKARLMPVQGQGVSGFGCFSVLRVIMAYLEQFFPVFSRKTCFCKTFMR